MHRPALLGLFRYPFERHALIHHNIFKADHTYHLQNEDDKHTIRMALWNGPALTAIGVLPFIVLGKWLGHPSAIPITAGATIFGYYLVYEIIHWCMHLPRQRNIERTGLFFRLNGHHLLHHRYMHKNFNVVFPLADLALGTLMLRSKVKFAQATGPAVPNVQPLEVGGSECIKQ